MWAIPVCGREGLINVDLGFLCSRCFGWCLSVVGYGGL